MITPAFHEGGRSATRKRNNQIDYHNEPLLILPLAVHCWTASILIPVICEGLPQEPSAQLWFIKRNYAELTRFEVTKNILRAIAA